LTKTTQGANTISSGIYNALGQQAENDFSGHQVEVVYDVAGHEVGWYDTQQVGHGCLPSNPACWWSNMVFLGSRPLEYAGSVFEHYNVLGTFAMLTSGSGTVLQDQGSYPYGQQWYNSASQYGVWFAGMTGEPDGDWIFKTQARMFNQYHGRWLTPDPGGKNVVRLDDPQTWNMYAYARNNPATLTDPSGLCLEDACVVEGIAALAAYAISSYLATPAGQANLRNTESLISAGAANVGRSINALFAKDAEEGQLSREGKNAVGAAEQTIEEAEQAAPAAGGEKQQDIERHVEGLEGGIQKVKELSTALADAKGQKARDAAKQNLQRAVRELEGHTKDVNQKLNSVRKNNATINATTQVSDHEHPQ